MKLSTFLLVAAVGLCAASSAEAQQAASKTSQRNSRANAVLSQANASAATISRQQRAQRTEFTVQSGRTDGVIARTVRAGDKFQMINPFAPAEYGDGRAVTRREVDDPYQRAQGIKLVSVEF